MILPNQSPTPRLPMLGRPQARIVWFAMAAAFVAAVVGAMGGAEAIPAAPGMVGEIFLAVATFVVFADLGIAFFVTSRIRRSPPPAAPPDAIAATQVIIGSATALSGAFICAIFFFISRQGLLLLLVLPCAIALCAWFPSERRWAALRPAGAPGEPGRRRMMRE